MLVLELQSPDAAEHLRRIALSLRSSKKTVFIVGAGISCNAGIPDFRSKEGLYSLVKRNFGNTFVKGKDLFDVILFRDERSTEVFYSFMAGLREATLDASPTPTHHLLKLLSTKKKLLRCYTQNIDGLEERVGLDSSEFVRLHGDLHRLKCMNCAHGFAWSADNAAKMHMGDAPDCEECASASLARSLSGKRSTAIGQLRPDIVLYGEDHPMGDQIAYTSAKDANRKPKLLIVAGTSLKVIGIKRLVKDMAAAVHAEGGLVVFVNRTRVSMSEWGSVFDYHVLADCDAWVSDVRRIIPSFFEVQTTLKVSRKRQQSGQGRQSKKLKEEPRSSTPPLPRLEKDLLLRSPTSFGVFEASPQPVSPKNETLEEPQECMSPISLN